MNTLAD